MSAGDCASLVRILPPRFRKGLPGFPLTPSILPPLRFPECHIRGEFEMSDAVHRIGAHCRLEAAHHLNGIIASMGCGIFNVCQSVCFCYLRGRL